MGHDPPIVIPLPAVIPTPVHVTFAPWIVKPEPAAPDVSVPTPTRFGKDVMEVVMPAKEHCRFSVPGVGSQYHVSVPT